MNPPLAPARLEMSDGRILWLEKEACTLGRSVNCTHFLDFPGVSRSHAMIQSTSNGGHLLADLRSTNGTYLNGIRIEQIAPLRDGDRVDLGNVALVYRGQLTPRQVSDTGATSVLIHSGLCWLMMIDLIGFTAHTQHVGTDAATADFKQWLELIRPILARSGGTINNYLGDAVFAYWRQDKHPAANVVTALHKLVAAQAACRHPFRIVIHHGSTHISGGLHGENLAGKEVNYLFRIEKSTKHLKAACTLSGTAASSLGLTNTARHRGSHEVPDYAGSHDFYTVDAAPDTSLAKECPGR